MAQDYCTGPCALFVGIGPGRTPVFLGHSESGFEIEERPYFEPLMNDLAGSRVPFDVQDMGEDAIASGTLTRWNEHTYNFLLSHPRSGGVPGTNIPGDRGMFLQQEGAAIPVWFQFPYNAKVAMAAGGLPPGRRYPFGMLERKAMGPCGSKALKRLTVFHFLPTYNALTGTFTLYDFNMNGLPAIN